MASKVEEEQPTINDLSGDLDRTNDSGALSEEEEAEEKEDSIFEFEQGKHLHTNEVLGVSKIKENDSENEIKDDGNIDVHVKNGTFSEEEKTRQEENASNLEQNELRRTSVLLQTIRNEGVPCILVLAGGTLKDNPDVLSLIARKVEEQYVANAPVNHEEVQVAKKVGNELLSSSGNVDLDHMRSSLEQEQQRQVEELSDAVTNFTNNITDDVPDSQPLVSAFDNAFSRLFTVPVTEQSSVQLLGTFFDLATFSMQVIYFCKKCQESKVNIALIVLVVGNQMFRIANKHGLITWMQSNGGWHGLYTRLHSYITQLMPRGTVSIPWPSWNTITLFGLTVFVTASTTYYLCKSK